MVPLLDLKQQYEALKPEIAAAINTVLEHQQFIMGPEVKLLEDEIKAYTGAKHAVACASGSDALLLALMALDVKPGELILTSPYTFFATGGAIARLGAIPVYLDIRPDDYNLDPAAVEAFLEGRHPLNKKFSGTVRAILPVHLYGQCADMGPLLELGKRFNLPIIEDAAQAIGAKWNGIQAGAIGTIGCFSFFPSKNLGAYGDAGIMTVNDDVLAEKLRILRLHGSKPKYYHKLVGINSRLDTLQAAILRVKLPHLESWSAARRVRAMKYNELFQKAGAGLFWKDLGCSPECAAANGIACKLRSARGKVVLPTETVGAPENNGRHIYHQYVVRLTNRDAVMDALNKAGIGNAIYYPVPLHEQECFANLNYAADDCPVSHCAGLQTLALPIYPELTDAQQEEVVKIIAGAL
jgi:dTDP-4-amino-4,6-dideoxygalactose transaminase